MLVVISTTNVGDNATGRGGAIGTGKRYAARTAGICWSSSYFWLGAQEGKTERHMIEIAYELLSPILFIIPVLGLVFVTLYLPSLVINRLFFHFRRRKGPILRFLSYPIGPSIPGRGADGNALRHALRRWAVLALATVSFAIASGLASMFAWVSVWTDGLTAAFLIAMFAALLVAVVSGVECVFLLVRLALSRPRNPTNSLTLPGNSEPPYSRVNPPAGKTNGFTRVDLRRDLSKA